MALYSIGGVSDQCGASSWAAHETGMVPLLSCEIDMTELMVEGKVQGVRCVRGKRKTWSYQSYR